MFVKRSKLFQRRCYLNTELLALREEPVVELLAVTEGEFIQKVAAHQIELELTESVLMEASQKHNAVLERLRELGVRLGIGQFLADPTLRGCAAAIDETAGAGNAPSRAGETTQPTWELITLHAGAHLRDDLFHTTLCEIARLGAKAALQPSFASPFSL